MPQAPAGPSSQTPRSEAPPDRPLGPSTAAGAGAGGGLPSFPALPTAAAAAPCTSVRVRVRVHGGASPQAWCPGEPGRCWLPQEQRNVESFLSQAL